MTRILYISVIFLIGLFFAGWSSKYVLDNNFGSNIINVGPWSALPFVGGQRVDPYTKSTLAITGKLPLGAAEGLVFTATTDSGGENLKLNCNYIISGDTPLSRLWTLVAYNVSGKAIENKNGAKSGVFSGAILRFPNSTFKISLGTYPRSGNWFPLNGKGEFKLVLTLYDTPITSDIGVIRQNMPDIKLEGCES